MVVKATRGVTPWALELQLRSFRLDSSRPSAKLLHNKNNSCPVGVHCTDHLLENRTVEEKCFHPVTESVTEWRDTHWRYWISCNVPHYYLKHHTTCFFPNPRRIHENGNKQTNKKINLCVFYGEICTVDHPADTQSTLLPSGGGFEAHRQNLCYDGYIMRHCGCMSEPSLCPRVESAIEMTITTHTHSKQNTFLMYKCRLLDKDEGLTLQAR